MWPQYINIDVVIDCTMRQNPNEVKLVKYEDMS